VRIGDLIGRMVPTPATATIARAADQSTVALALTRNWRHALQTIAEKIDGKEAARADLVAKRRDLLVQELDGEPAAAKELTRVETEIAAVDRDLARLRDARGLAAERTEADETAARRQAAADAMRAWESGNTELQALAERADELARLAADAFLKAADAAERQAAACPVPLDGAPSDRPLGQGRIAHAIQTQMAVAGVGFARSGIGFMPWREADVPTAKSTVAAGLAWARAEIQRRGARA